MCFRVELKTADLENIVFGHNKSLNVKHVYQGMAPIKSCHITDHVTGHVCHVTCHVCHVT